MQVQVNGESRDVADGLTVSALLQQLQVQPERVVVEVNLTILRRHQLPQTVLQPGDTVESLAHRMQGVDRQVDRFRVLNGLDARATLKPRERVKIVVD